MSVRKKSEERMSKKTCWECIHYNSAWSYCRRAKAYLHAMYDQKECPFIDEPPTVFERITASPEVLAKELVTTSYDEFKDCTVYWAWLGNGRREAYYSKPEAISATVARLKEVAE